MRKLLAYTLIILVTAGASQAVANDAYYTNVRGASRPPADACQSCPERRVSALLGRHIQLQ